MADLVDRGYDAELLVSEDDDISLEERVRRVNTACFLLGKANVILVSIHVNAAGNGSKWMNATGWSVYTCKGRTASDKLAECLCESAIKNFPGRRIRTDMSDGNVDWEENFYILRKSLCPAVLTENFFMDNHSDRGSYNLLRMKFRPCAEATSGTKKTRITDQSSSSTR